MQLYALDEKSALVCAKQALKNKNYQCLECQSLLRLRGGIHRQNHFYHVEQIRSCRQNGKSLEHLQVQLFLQKLFGEKDCHLEKRFKEIERIADVVWISKKIVFEVQCSPISKNEVVERNEDYEKIGYSVVWILHDKRFNQYRVSEVEQFLCLFPHYYTNMDRFGKGIFYDNFRLFQRGRQVFKTEKFAVDFRNLKKKAKEKPKQLLPLLLKKRMDKAPYYFEGDVIDYCLSDSFESSLFEKALKFERKTFFQLSSWKILAGKVLKKIFVCYKSLFRILLEKACQ